MRHVVLGAGGIGGLLAAVLTRAGEEVTVVLRPDSAARHHGEQEIRSAVFGDFTATVEVATAAPAGADVAWIAVKATALPAALDLVDPGRIGDALVVPLLNGIDHVAVLRQRYRRVCAATIRVESHRTAPGVIEQPSPFAHVALAAGATAVADALRRSGFETSTTEDETTLLWDKLAFLAPVALATAAHDRPLGAVRADPDFVACQQEAVAAAHADGARTELGAVRARVAAAPASMTSSMQHDVAAGREPELDAIAGAILRRSARHGAPATRALADQVRRRVKAGTT